ncbi:MAG: hypothetical protein BWY82_01404 [Verrucomicrobia bacterium ADurb.Bin474]|nr:MAG: hypothetical protein BWY82_01404 [Verrucomicrobia bacterium ADurb.Bin474]
MDTLHAASQVHLFRKGFQFILTNRSPDQRVLIQKKSFLFCLGQTPPPFMKFGYRGQLRKLLMVEIEQNRIQIRYNRAPEPRLHLGHSLAHLAIVC